MTNYSFKTESGFRIDVEGSSPDAALRTILKLGMYKYPRLESHYVTPYFITYDSNGISDMNFISTPLTEKIIKATYKK